MLHQSIKLIIILAAYPYPKQRLCFLNPILSCITKASSSTIFTYLSLAPLQADTFLLSDPLTDQAPSSTADRSLANTVTFSDLTTTASVPENLGTKV